MMYKMDDNLYDDLWFALVKNGCDDSDQFNDWLDDGYTPSELLAAYENNGRKYYHNLVDWVNEELYNDFLTEMSNNAVFLAEFGIEKVKEDEDDDV